MKEVKKGQSLDDMLTHNKTTLTTYLPQSILFWVAKSSLKAREKKERAGKKAKKKNMLGKFFEREEEFVKSNILWISKADFTIV